MYHAVVSIQLLNKTFHVIGAWWVLIFDLSMYILPGWWRCAVFFKCRSVMHVYLCLSVYVAGHSEVWGSGQECRRVGVSGQLWQLVDFPSFGSSKSLPWEKLLAFTFLGICPPQAAREKKSRFQKEVLEQYDIYHSWWESGIGSNINGRCKESTNAPLIFCWLIGWPFCCLCRWGGEYGGTASDSSGCSSFSLNYTGDCWLTRLAPASWHFRPTFGSASWLGWGQFQARGAKLESTELW